MASFKVCVRNARSDGFYTVYIRVTHNRKVGYIKTDKIVNGQGLDRKGEVIDGFVLQSLNARICDYMMLLNRNENISAWDLKDVLELLKSGNGDISFSLYAKRFIADLINRGVWYESYKYAVASLESYVNQTDVSFAQLTTIVLRGWLKSLEHTHRAKALYSFCVRKIWRAAMLEYNDEDRDILRIRNPWQSIKLPKTDFAKQLAITPDQCRSFFDFVPTCGMHELSQDVMKMMLCLGGINAVDLFRLKKSDYFDNIIHYKRSKTKHGRRDEAYFEMRVPELIRPLVDKYANTRNTEWLFDFVNRFANHKSFNGMLNGGLDKICRRMGMSKENYYKVYTFRHTWGTIAQNDCGASISEVAFAMNHIDGFSTTRGYLKLNFEPAWILNEKVVDYIFNEGRKTKDEVQAAAGNGGHTETAHRTGLSRFSSKHYMRGTAYYNGRVLGSVEDIGFNNVEEILQELYKFLPDDMPNRAVAKFKIENIDKDEVAMFERMKGKSF